MGKRLGRILGALGWALLGAMGAGLALYVAMSRALPDLQPWHQAPEVRDFRAGDAGGGWQAYLEKEREVFDGLSRGTAASDDSDPLARYSRFNPAGLLDPQNFSTNWNRTYEHPAPEPASGGVLLIHGLSDSPYSTRALGELFRRRGYHVLGLRVPGHGTAPGALAGASRRDWQAAMELAVRRVAEQAGAGAPLVLAGYSNGAALCVDYALRSLADPALPRPGRLVLVSPALAVTPVAGLARFQRLLSYLPGLGKMAWTAVQPEYDPYKYNSFPVRAAEEIHRLTHGLDQRLSAAAGRGRLAGFPPVLAFQSVVDSTVPPQGVERALLSRLPADGSELVLFDVNRRSPVEPFLTSDHDALLAALETRSGRSYELTVVTNRAADDDQLRARRLAPGDSAWADHDLALAWPAEVYSLSHVALPFPPDDPLYGDAPHQPEAGPMRLGNVVLRGESAVFGVPTGQLMRLRYNPFFSYLEKRVEEFVGNGP